MFLLASSKAFYNKIINTKKWEGLKLFRFAFFEVFEVVKRLIKGNYVTYLVNFGDG